MMKVGYIQRGRGDSRHGEGGHCGSFVTGRRSSNIRDRIIQSNRRGHVVKMLGRGGQGKVPCDNGRIMPSPCRTDRKWTKETKTVDLMEHKEDIPVKSNNVANVDVGDGKKTSSCKRNKYTHTNPGQNINIPCEAAYCNTVGSNRYVKAVSQKSEPPENSSQVEGKKVEAKHALKKISVTREKAQPSSRAYFPAINNVSKSTGLKVFSIRSLDLDYEFTPSDRATVVHTIPGVVIMNTFSEGDVLILGIAIDDDDRKSPTSMCKFTELYPDWLLSPVDTTDKDPFSYFEGWQLIPQIDRSGMFRITVGLGTGNGTLVAINKTKDELQKLIKDFNVTKIIYGTREIILLVTHVLEFVAYSDMIRKSFSVKRCDTWNPKPIVQQPLMGNNNGKERHFWVKVKCPELNNLTTAHKQYSVFHHLSSIGKVIQLEHQLFGVEDNYLVVFNDIEVSKIPLLGQNFSLLELLPDALPNKYLPHYGVDVWGFYSVSGKFPNNVSNETKNKFAEDMKRLGAVGFRSGESNDEFSLHFVNSRCLDQISRCVQYVIYKLTILSNLVRKRSPDRRLKKMVPSILMYNNFEGIKSRNVGLKDFKTSLQESRASSFTASKSPVKLNDHVEPSSKENHVKNNLAKKISVEKSKSVNKKDNIEELIGSRDESIEVSETDLLKICNKKDVSSSLYSRAKSLLNLVRAIPEMRVYEIDSNIVFNVPKEKFIETLMNVSGLSSLNLDNLKTSRQEVELQPSKYQDNRFGLVVGKGKTVAQLKKGLSKFDVEIEVRNKVFVLWFGSKVSLYQALLNSLIKEFVQITICAQNLKFVEAESPRTKSMGIEKLGTAVVSSDNTESKKHELTEREICGSIWHRGQAKTDIRDDQMISRQLTNLVKNVSCVGLTVGEEGLIIRFSSESEKDAAVAKFCYTPGVVKDQPVETPRMFSLLPFRGLFGLFSVKRVKVAHFTRFGNCKIRNYGIWFSEKLALFNSLRDPFIKKTYPTLFIDCKNIFILNSKDFISIPESQDLSAPTADSCHEASVLTLSTTGECCSSSNSPISKVVEIMNSQVEEKVKGQTLPIQEVHVHLNVERKTLSNGEVLLGALLPLGMPRRNQKVVLRKTKLGQGKFGYNLGKIPHISTTTKQDTDEGRLGVLADLLEVGENESKFSDAKDTLCSYRSVLNEAKELAALGEKRPQSAGGKFNDIKIENVEHFIKDKLGVKCRISKEGKDKLLAGGILEEADNDRVNKQEFRLDSENNLEKLGNDNDFCISDINVDESFESKRERLLIKDEKMRAFLKEALIFPNKYDMAGTDEDKERDCNGIKEGDVEVITDGISNTEAPKKLSADCLGLYTLYIPLTDRSDITICTVQEDMSWFDQPASIIQVEDMFMNSACIEVKFKQEEIATAVLQGLMHKYPTMVGDYKGNFKNIVRDKRSGLYTLCFTDSKKKKFKATMDKFSAYCSDVPPVISRGVGGEQVMVGFQREEEAKRALLENLESDEFPGMHVAPASRG